ncbi:MAG: Abi family protein [Eggerthellaceae bacterium]|nr:Abi family protein [Eggerthellaceae bacterium]
MSEDEAERYLAQNNNYFRLRSYRTNFVKVPAGKRAGEYENLDFKMLVDLSIIDMLLRNELLPMTLDIEHFFKVRLLSRIEEQREDGYKLVADYLATRDEVQPSGKVGNRVKEEISRGTGSPYMSSLIKRYQDGALPVWVFLEVISFGTFIHFYRFCAKRFNDKDMIDEYYLLQNARHMRNACAHNNCLLNNTMSGGSKFEVSRLVSNALGEVPGIGRGMRRAKMRNDLFQGIATVFYLHKEFASPGIHGHRAASLHEFTGRMNKHADYYGGNDQVNTGFRFIDRMVEAWFPLTLDGGSAITSAEQLIDRED